MDAFYQIKSDLIIFKYPIHGNDKLYLHYNGVIMSMMMSQITHDCLLNCLFRCRSNKSSKLRVTGLCDGNSPGTCELSTQMASNAENVSIWWRHHVTWSNYLARCRQVYDHCLSIQQKFVSLWLRQVFLWIVQIWYLKCINVRWHRTIISLQDV